MRRFDMAPGRRTRKALAFLAWVISLVLLLAGGLRLIDGVVARRAASTTRADVSSTELTIRSLELFPYDGFHVQPNFHHRGPMPWELYTPDADFDVRTGDKGFFIDFSLEDPPPKAPDEFRIILIGGSGAQGWGATRNERMFYSLAERALNERLAGRGVHVRVINLAMGGSTIYQNYLALNQWGHALEPDLILAYVGRNEFWVPLNHSDWTDAFAGFGDLDAFSLAMRGDEYPPGLAWLVRLMPNTMRRTSIGLGVKLAWGWEHFKQRAWSSYTAARGQRTDSPQQVVDENVVPRLVHSLRSIKRDFDGVPVMVIWQPIREELSGRMKDERGMVWRALKPGFYDEMFERTKRETAGFLNDRWFFVNLHELSKGIQSRR
ncbi:MAG TPA: SGNH/GDSL hydrolase family protein, partial [bacterium]